MKASSLSLVASVLVACSSGSNPFVGVWGCTLTETITTTLASGDSKTTMKAPATINIALSGDTKIHAAGAGWSGASCGLDFTTSGSTATIVAGQTCNAGGTVTYSSGTATVNGQSLQLDVAYTLPADASGNARSGTGSYACTMR